MSSCITWLMPVKNGMPFIQKTLESIALQTYTDHEILVWDNGSTDGTLELLNDWIPSRIRGEVVFQLPLSYSASLAQLVERARTDLCARIDADDVNVPQRLQMQASFLRENPKVVAVGGQVNKISSVGENCGLYHKLPLEHEAIVVRMLRLWSMWHPTVMFRRDAVLAAGNYLDERPVEDYSLWLRLAKQGRLANVPDVLLNYRVHENSVTETAKRDATLQDSISSVVRKHGPSLYGLTAQELQDLLNGHQFPLRRIVPIWQSLRRHHCYKKALLDALSEHELKQRAREMLLFRLLRRLS